MCLAYQSGGRGLASVLASLVITRVSELEFVTSSIRAGFRWKWESIMAFVNGEEF